MVRKLMKKIFGRLFVAQNDEIALINRKIFGLRAISYNFYSIKIKREMQPIGYVIKSHVLGLTCCQIIRLVNQLFL